MAHPYKAVPKCILKRVTDSNLCAESYCAGFECSEWRCDGLAENLIGWIIDYALRSEELRNIDHTNSYIRLREAAVRVYTSEKYEKRGEIGEIAAHAICRTFFGTIPVAARVNYLSASNDPVKAFDLVHVRYNGEESDEIELWLGEAKFYTDRNAAVRAAIASINSHITAGFLKNEKLLLGPQISNDIPHYDKIRELLSSETPLDELIQTAVFPVLIAANSDATAEHTSHSPQYTEKVESEMQELWDHIASSDINKTIKLKLIYVPSGDKNRLSAAFDRHLKALQK